MRMERMGEDHVAVLLLESDLMPYGLSFQTLSAGSEQTRLLLGELFSQIYETYQIDFSKGSALIEAIPYESGCILFIGKKHRKKRAADEKNRYPLAFDFYEAEQLLQFFRKAAAEGLETAGIYRIHGIWRVLAYPREAADNRLLACGKHYGRFAGQGVLQQAVVAEYGIEEISLQPVSEKLLQQLEERLIS